MRAKVESNVDAGIIERIRKLFALAHGRGATEAEAATALEKANSLLLMHNLSMDAVAGETPVEAVTEEGIQLGRVENWRHQLISTLASHNLCSMFFDYNRIVLVGRPTNIATTRAMFDWIGPQLLRLADLEYRDYQSAMECEITERDGQKWCPQCDRWLAEYDYQAARPGTYTRGDEEIEPFYDFDDNNKAVCSECDTRVLDTSRIHGRTWKASFMRGIVRRVGGRLHAQRRAQSTPAPTQPDAPPGAGVTALVVRTGRENEDYMRLHHPDLVTKPRRDPNFHSGAYARGSARGADVSLGGSSLGNGVRPQLESRT